MEQPVEEEVITQPLEEEAMDQSSSLRLLEEQRMVEMVEPAEKVIVEQVVEIETMNQPAIDMVQHQIEESSMQQIRQDVRIDQLQAAIPIHDSENVGTNQLQGHVSLGQTTNTDAMGQMHAPATADVPLQYMHVTISEQSQQNEEMVSQNQIVAADTQQANTAIDQPNVAVNPPHEYVTINQPMQNVSMNQPHDIAAMNQSCENVTMNQPIENITINQPRENVSINQSSQNDTSNQLCKIAPLNQSQENVIGNQRHENIRIDQPRENVATGTSGQSGENIQEEIDQLHENIALGQSDQPSENIMVDRENIATGTSNQPYENIHVAMDQPRENSTLGRSDQPNEDIPVDQPRKNIPADQPRESITTIQPPENETKVQSHETVILNQPNTSSDQLRANSKIDQSCQNITVNLLRENLPADQQPEKEIVNQLHQAESNDQPPEDQTLQQPHHNATADQSSENLLKTDDQSHVSKTRNQTHENVTIHGPGDLAAIDRPSDKVTTVSQKKDQESADIVGKISNTNDPSEKSMDQPQVKPMLMFCKTCGNFKLCDVTEQLQKLFAERNLKPNACGICHKVVEQEKVDIKSIQMNIKKEFDEDDYEEIKFPTSPSKSTSRMSLKINQKQIGAKTGKKRRKSMRQSSGTPIRTYNEPSTSGSDSDHNSSDSDYEMEDMVICEEAKKIKTEENGEEKTSGKSPSKPNLKERKFMDPELVRYLAPCDGANVDFVCKICQESCKFIGAFAKHISRHTHKRPIQKPYRCYECKENFEVRGFRKHFQRHHVKPYQCGECEFSFKSERDLRGHTEYHRGTRSNYCDICGLAFISKLDLTKHGANHGGGGKHQCEYCNKSYNHIVKLREHKRKNHKEKKLTCGLCPFACFTTEELENHLKMHSQDQIKCANCHHVFSTQLVFDFHIQIQSCKAPAEFADDKSNEDINIADILETIDPKLVSHMAKPVMAHEPFRCKYCTDKDFSAARLFLQHLLQSHPTLDIPEDNAIFHCNLCSKQYERRCELTKHLRSHSDAKPYECAYTNCNKAYKRRDLLNRHHETHVAAGDTLPVAKLTDDEVKEILQQLHPQLLGLIVVPEDKDHPFACKFCDVKQFFKSANICLNHIKKMHPEIECPTHAYSCDQCDQTFQMKAALQRHSLGHSEYRPFVCTVEGCGKGFKRKDKLKAHQEIHATGGKRHMCCTCGMWFSSKSGLKKHTNNVHLKNFDFKCSFCGKAFPIKSRKDHHEKTRHIGLREWVCELCGKSFNKRVELTQHMYYHSGEKPYACDYCEYRCVRLDYLKKHVKTHSRDKPYKCNVCSEQFLLRDTLVLHMKKHHGLTSPDILSKIKKVDIPVVIKKRKLDSDVAQESQSYICMTTAGHSFQASSGEQVIYESKPNAPVEMYQVISYPNASTMQ